VGSLGEQIKTLLQTYRILGAGKYSSAGAIDYIFCRNKTKRIIHKKQSSQGQFQKKSEGKFPDYTLFVLEIKSLLQKTWRYHQRISFGSDLPALIECFNHSTQRQTMKYLSVQ
jgi:hypothetical protein